MKKTLLSMLTLGLFTSAAQATLLKNGDFEVNPLAPNRSWSVFDAIDGWVTTSGSGIEVQRNTIVRAHSGNYYIELDSHAKRDSGLASNSAMTQSVTTVAGQRYELSFFYLPRTNKGSNDNGLGVFWDSFDNNFAAFDPSHQVFSIENMKRRDLSQWTQYTVELTATSDTMALSFAGQGRSNTLGAFIDDVSLTPVSAPGSLALLGIGLAGLGWMRKKHTS